MYFCCVLTWQSGAEFVRIGLDDAVLERPAADAGAADQAENFPLEGRHPRHLLVKHQLGLVELVVLLGAVHLFPFPFTDLSSGAVERGGGTASKARRLTASHFTASNDGAESETAGQSSISQNQRKTLTLEQ